MPENLMNSSHKAIFSEKKQKRYGGRGIYEAFYVD